MRRAIPITLTACVAAGCSIGTSDTVEEIRPEELAALDQTSTTSTTAPVEDTSPVETVVLTVEPGPPDTGSVPDDPTTTSMPETTTTVAVADARLYFVHGSRLVAVDTPVPTPLGVRRVLDALGGGPPSPEFEQGIRTAVPVDLVTGIRKARDLITVRLDGDLFRGIDPEDQRYVVAQIVLTLTDLPGIHRVLFTTDGEPLRVFQRDDVLSEPGEPVTRDDYAELLTPTPRSS